MTQKVMIELIKQHHGQVSDAQARLWLNQAMKDFCRKTKTLESAFQFTTTADQRFYDLPQDCVKVLDIRCKHHNNEDDKYRSIPRSIYEPLVVDEDGV